MSQLAPKFTEVVVSKNSLLRQEKYPEYSQTSVYNDHPWNPKIVVLKGGPCPEVIYVVNGTSKWWPLLTGGSYSEVVISLGLTV